MKAGSIYPKAMGTEEETRYITYNGDSVLIPGNASSCAAPSSVVGYMHELCPPLLQGSEYLVNGSRVYTDKASVELATAESNTPAVAFTTIEANMALRVGGLTKLARHKAVDGPYTAVVARRVIDSAGNTWGCHDNFSVDSAYATVCSAVTDKESPLGRLWRTHFLSSRFVTGAGLVKDDGMLYSQKLSVPHQHTDHTYKPTFLTFRNVPVKHDEREYRLETRCNEINLKEWAVTNRTGCSALLTGASLVPQLIDELSDKLQVLDIAAVYENQIALSPDGTIKGTEPLEQSLLAQRIIWSTILGKLATYAKQPIPPHLLAAAIERAKFCSDFETVLQGKAPLSSLADRADWAQKAVIICGDIRKRKTGDIGDARSKAIDQLYDRTRIVARPGKDGLVNVQTYESMGSRLDAKHRTTTKSAITRAMNKPPVGTRAEARVKTAKDLGAFVTKCDWTTVSFENKASKIEGVVRLPL